MRNLNLTQTENSLLNEDLLNELENSEMKFNESKKSSTRFCFWAGEELSMSSMRKNLNAVDLQDHEKELKKLQKEELCELLLDDGWLHVTLSNSLFTQEFLNDLLFD
jgi:hypothetical protein